VSLHNTRHGEYLGGLASGGEAEIKPKGSDKIYSAVIGTILIAGNN